MSNFILKTHKPMLVTLISCVVLSACGGGGGSNSAAVSSAAPSSLPVSSPVTIPESAATPAAPVATPAAPATSTDTEMASASLITVPAKTTATTMVSGDKVTDLVVQNTGAAQTRVPVTFGQVFVPGQIGAGTTVVGRLPDGTSVPLQVDVKARHADGSLRHAVLSTVLPSLAQGASTTIELVKSSTVPANTAATPDAMLGAGFTSNVTIVVDGVTYTASADQLLRTGKYTTWLAGPVATEWMVNAPLKNSAGVAHPYLNARFAMRWYPNAVKKARVELVVENVTTFTPGIRNFTYDVDFKVDGKSAYQQTGLTHLWRARWHQMAWWDGATPAVHLKHNIPYLLASKAVPNYDQSVTVDEGLLQSYATDLTASRIGPMKTGMAVGYMPMSGGRPDIAPLPGWTAAYLLSMDIRAKNAMMVTADGSGSFSNHYRDEATGQPVRLDNAVNRLITTHSNFLYRGPLPVPRCANDNWNLCVTPYESDVAHQPSLTYVPYLVTGDLYYLEEMQFFAAANPLGTDPGAHGYELGLVSWDQIRGQAWAMRTLGHVAYITPDDHPLKAYFTTQLNNNLDHYYKNFVVNNPNNLGAYDGTGDIMAESQQSAPWQDDFLTWSFGNLTELGFTKAKPILDWKAKFPVGRMTAPGFCWIEASAYFLTLRAVQNGPVANSFADMYKLHFGDGTHLIDDGDHILKNPQGTSYFDQPCGSQAQADWRTASGTDFWRKGQMVGYSGSNTGFPSNMQPALAVAATTGIPNAAMAWTIFNTRGVKPNYGNGPQWAIVPR